MRIVICPVCERHNKWPLNGADCPGCGFGLVGVQPVTAEAATRETARETAAREPDAGNVCKCATPEPMASGRCATCFHAIASSATAVAVQLATASDRPVQGVRKTVANVTLGWQGEEFQCVQPVVLGRLGAALPHRLAEAIAEGYPGVSERHAILVHHGGELMLIDLNSTNGTFVQTAHGEWVRIGRGPFTLAGPGRIRLGERCELSLWWETNT